MILETLQYAKKLESIFNLQPTASRLKNLNNTSYRRNTFILKRVYQVVLAILHILLELQEQKGSVVRNILCTSLILCLRTNAHIEKYHEHSIC